MKRSNYETLKAWRERSVAKYQARPRKASETRPDTPQAARKRAEDSEYRRNRDIRLMRAGGRCEFQGAVDFMVVRCSSPATQTHHVIRRSHTGSPDHSASNLRALCATHHSYLHSNVQWAKENGWILVKWPTIDVHEEV